MSNSGTFDNRKSNRNKKGRPLKGEAYRDYYEFYMQYSESELHEWVDSGKLNAKARGVVERILRSFKSDKAQDAIENRVDGAPKQPIEHEIIDKSIEVIFKDADDTTKNIPADNNDK